MAISFTPTKIARFVGALYGVALNNSTYAAATTEIYARGFDAVANEVFAADFGTKTTAQVAATVVANLGLTGAAATEGAAYVEGQLNAAAANARGAVIMNVLNLFAGLVADATYGTAATAFEGRVANAINYSLAASSVQHGAFGNLSSGTVLNLTTAFDNLVGTSGDDTFTANSFNNANSLTDGDTLDGGTGTDTLVADIANPANGAITPITSNIEVAKFRVQHGQTDTSDNNIANSSQGIIDAQRMAGVTWWEDNNSRSDLIIEDVRIADGQKTKDITVAMVDTDPGNVDFGLYFDQHSLRNSGTGTTSLIINLMDTGAAGAAATAATPLLNNPYDQFKLGINGVLSTIQLDKVAVAAADTYAALLTVFQNALAGSGITVALSGTFTITDPISSTSVTGQSIVLTGGSGIAITSPAGSGWYNTTGASVPPTSNIYTTYTNSATSTTELVTSTVVLDNVGRGSTGGDLLIGGLSVGETSTSRGVERFEIEVRDSSKLQTINSTNNALREVTIKSGNTSLTDSTVTAYNKANFVTNEGDLTVNGNAKNSLGADQGSPSADNQVMDGANEGATATHQGANAAGFTDVRLIDATEFKGKLAFTAAITSDSIAKYVNLVDTAADPLADVAGSGNVNYNVLGANFIYTGGNDNDTMVVDIESAAAASRSTIVSGQTDMTFVMNGGDGNDAITVNINENGNLQNWYNNQDLNNNITINGGAGDDTIRVPGAGDTTIDAGTGADTVWADNTGSQTGLNAGGGVSVTTLGSGTASNGIWVFNTYDQVNAVANGAARNIYDIRSDVMDTYNLYKSTLTVSFKGIISSTITLANTTTYKTTDLEINQAIKNAIITNATLSKLLTVQDGPGNSLIVTSLVDGVQTVTDLAVTLAAPTTGLTAAEEVAARTAWGLAVGADVYAPMAAQIIAFNTTNGDYVTQMAQDAAGTNIVGAASTSTSDNFITPGEGNDVLVFGTTESLQDVGRSSNDVAVFSGTFGDDVIVNFDVAGNGIDHINLYAYLDSATAVTLSGSSVAANNFTATKSIINMMQEITGSGATANDTEAKVQALYRAAADTAASASAVNSAVIVVNNTTNVGTVYSIVNGTGANDAIASRKGSINLGDLAGSTASTWSTISVNNFQVPVVNTSVVTGATTITSEGPNTELVGTTMTAIANNQILVGTANIDTLNTGGFDNVTMTGNGSGDLFQVASGSNTIVITDLVTGDDFTVNGTVASDLAVTTTGFTASAATSHTGVGNTKASVVLTAAAAGATINMALASGTLGYTLTGAAGNDTLTGSSFADTLSSGATGTDVLNGGAGDDAMSSGGGTVTFNGGTGNNAITAGGGVDTINTVSGGIDTVTAFAAADVITVASGGVANVTSGAIWSATASSSNSGTLNFTAGAAGVYDFSLMAGSAGINFTGNAGADTITGTARADTINAGGGADDIIGGAGSNTITLTVDAASDIVQIGSGVDTIANFLVGGGAGADDLRIDISEIEAFIGGSFNLSTTDGADFVAAAVSVETVAGAAVFGAAANELLIVNGNIASASALETALEVGGGFALTTTGAFAANDGFLVAYDDGANTYIAAVKSTAGAGAGATFAAADLTATVLVQLTGVTDVTTLVAGDFAAAIA